MPHWPKPYGRKIEDFKLERIKALLEKLGNPQKKLAPVIHVAGTNGKGSTIAFLRAILESSGYKVHVYTSPHISKFNERIVLAGKDIDNDYLYQLCEETRVASGDLQVTFFEGTTAVAFLAFSRADADVVLVETGMGGRLDATNVIDKPIASVITPISYDHTEFLGETITQIAKEKAGIIKPNTPCIISWQLSEAKEILCNQCEKIGSTPFICGEYWNFAKSEEGFIYSDTKAIELPKPSLFGIHQIINASTAIATLRCIDQYKVSLDDIVYGIQNAKWPARMQQIKGGSLYALLPNQSELWLDAAHNPAGAEMLAATLSTMSKRPTFLINGRTRNRDMQSFLSHFLNKVEMVCCVSVESEPLSEKPEKIDAAAKALGMRSIVCTSLTEAIKTCVQNTSNPIRIVICGSLYLASDLMKIN